MRREVLSLLAEERSAERLMEVPAAGAGTQKVAVTRGTRLGPYEVIELIGAGGMGEVYRARDTRLGRDVAVKVLARRLRLGPGTAPPVRARGSRRRLARPPPHPSPSTTLAPQDGTPYVVTELLEGETLARGALAPAARSLKQALVFAHARPREGLAAAHKQGDRPS